jgi:methylase of polypeptide subunit release factors
MVIATELLNSSAWVAALNFRLNQINPGDGRGRLAVCMTDVARGLRPECADFVISNPPFVPAPPHDALDRPLTYADGGPSGLELPARFIREGAKLLAQGGTAVTRCFDITFDDGRRPLADVCSTLQAQGFAAFIEPVRAEDESAAVTEGLRARGLAMTAVISNVIVERSAL